MINKLVIRTTLLSVTLLTFLLAGCGSAKKEGAADPTAAATKIDNSNCTSTCHAATTSKVASAIAGAAIPTDWAASKHATAAAADCQDCHGGGSNHWGLGPIPTANPDTAQTCTATCHANMPAPHFNNITSGNGYPASFVNSQDKGMCRICHNPHNPTTQMPINVEWAASGKGDVNSPAWANREFKNSGHNGNPAISTASDCVRCHTTTGYINYITSNFASVRAWGTAGDKTKETLQCNACHDKSYDFSSQRSLGAVQAFYNYSSRNTKKLLVNFTFPSVGKSNICMLCHVGRESGLTLAAVAALPGSGASFVNYSGQSFINSHYLTAGATVFGVSGYEFVGQGYTGSTAHVNVESAAGGTQGPCVSCHMQALTLINGVNKPSHKFKPELTSASGINCVGCHTGSGVAVTSEATLEAAKSGYEDALAVLAAALRKRGFIFQQANPYFTKTNWQTGKTGGTTGGYGAGTGQNMLGAAFNFNLLVHDPGGFAHNATYAKRLIYDSIVFAATGGFTFPATTADPVTVNNITELINDTTLVPAYTDLVAASSGPSITLTAGIRTAAIAWLTNGTGNRP